MKIRRAAPDDLDILFPLYLAFFAEDGIHTPAASVRTNLARMLADDRACIFLAEENDAPVGLASGSLTNGVEFGCATELEDLYVIPQKRGKGLANRLISAAVSWATDHEATEAILVITPQAEHEQALSRFYMKMGFANAERIMMYRSLRPDSA